MKNKRVLLSLALVSILTACGTKTSPSSEASKNTIIDPVTTDVVIPTKESEEEINGEGAYATKLLLNHRSMALHHNKARAEDDPRDSMQLVGLPQANHTGENLAFVSANPEIATVDENGVVTAMSNGYTSIEVSDKAHPELKTTVPVYVYADLKTRAANSIINKLANVDEDGLREIVDHELYQKKKYKNGVLELSATWDQHLICSYDEAYFRIEETDADIITTGANVTFKDYEWIFYTNPAYDAECYHTVGDTKNFFPVPAVSYMDQNLARTAPLFDILDNIFVSGRKIFSNTFENAKLSGFLEYAQNDYSNVKKGIMASIDDSSSSELYDNKTFLFSCEVTYKDSEADQDDETRYGIPYGTPTPSVYSLRFLIKDNQMVGWTNHGVMTYDIGNDHYEEVYDIDHFYERITDENRDSFIKKPNRDNYSLVDYLFAI